MLIAAILDRATGSLGDALPRVAGAILLLLLGLVAAWVVGRIARKAFETVGLDALAERVGIHDVLAQVGLERSASRVLARAIRLALTIVVVVASLSLLGLAALEQTLNEVVLFLPKLFIALLLVLAGVLVGDLVRGRLDRVGEQMGLGRQLGLIAQAAIIALFGLTALAQLGIPTQILMALVSLVVFAGALTLALAFGLGGRDVARQLSAGRYVGGAFRVGETIAVGGVEGEILALEGAATVLRTDEGRTVRVPNHLLLDSIVSIGPRPTDSS